MGAIADGSICESSSETDRESRESDILVQNLLDCQQMQGEGLDMHGKSVGRYSPHTEDADATLDMLPEALAVPTLLDAAIMTYVCRVLTFRHGDANRLYQVVPN